MKYIFVIFFILFLYILLITFNFKETFNNSKSKKFRKFRNIFTTTMFENKTIFLIANNPKLSEKTKKFLNNYDYKDSLIVRFNGYKPIIKDYCNGKTDIMVYRQAGKSFLGYQKSNFNKNITNVFTKDLLSNESEFDKYYYINSKYYAGKYHNLPKSYSYISTGSFKNIDFPKKCSWWLTTGFNFLIYLLHLKNIKKIYLIGYTFHSKKDSQCCNGEKVEESHCEIWEYNYFKKNIENKRDVEILL